MQLEHLACSCGSPSAPPSWLYEREVNQDSYWITGFSIHMQAPPATQLCDSGGLSVLWKVFTGPCWCGADIYSGGGNEDSSTQVEPLDCSELPEGPVSHWIQCAKFKPPGGLYLTLFVQLILEACLVHLLYGCTLWSHFKSHQAGYTLYSLWQLWHMGNDAA